jgi:sporulation and spore germination protein/immunoglobulin-like protein involved in spore germination
MTRLTRVAPLVVLLLAGALLAACSPSVGALGTPAAPPPTAEPSLELPSGDATPDLSSPAPTGTPDMSPSPTAPGASASPSPAPTTRPTPTGAPSSGEVTVVRSYFVLGSFTDNAGVAPVLREVPQTRAVATAAMRALLAGPNEAEMAARPAMYTAVPDGTTLLGISIADGVAIVNLSREFESGGGSESMQARLAQVVYTLTQFRTVTGVRFELDGVPVTAFGGEGIVLDRPVGREDFRDQLPAIFVDRPAWGASLGNPGTVSGEANVFEASFQVTLLDAGGRTLIERTVTASCGTGCWGSFRTSLSYTVSRAQWGTLRVFEPSARDGTPVNVTEYPVWLTPAG